MEWKIKSRDSVIANVLPLKREPNISTRESIAGILSPNSVAELGTVVAGTCMLVDPNELASLAQPISDLRKLSEDDVQLLVRLLLDPRSWFFAFKRCLPKPTALIKLTGRHGDAKLYIGMSCENWELHIRGDSHSGFFDPVTLEIRGILKRTFAELASTNSQSMWKAGAIAQLKQRYRSQMDVAEQSDPPKSPVGREFES